METFTFNPSKAQFAADDFTAKTVTVHYYYIDGNGCDDEAFFDVNIFQQPPTPFAADFVVCFTSDDDELSFTESVPGSTITWYSTAADVGTPNFIAQGETFKPTLNELNLVDYFVTQKINNCESPSRKITVGQIASPDFTHEGICVGTPTNFVVPGDLTGIATMIWTIEEMDGTPISVETFTGTNISANYAYTFTDIGRKVVTLEFLSAINCTASVTKTIFIVPSIVLSGEYLEDFEGNNGWISWGNDSPVSSWENATPAGSVINSGTKSWITNADGIFPDNEESFVYSPCFDISALSRPMISFDIFSDLDISAGAVLQYSSDGRFGTWKTIGTDNTGIKWYDVRGLNNVPGGTSSNIFAYGWSEENSGWKNARHPLDEIPVAERNSLIFRIAFNSSTNSKLEGFAFDNFRISEKYRLVVLEHFESTADDKQADYIDDQNVPENEMISLHYRTNLAGDDPMATSESSARLEYYGFTTAPEAIFDGSESEEGKIDEWFNSTFTERSLVEPTMNVNMIVGQAEAGIIKVLSEISAREDVNDPFLIHTVIVEIDANGLKNVVRKLLPDAGGAKHESLLTSDAPIQLDYEWSINALTTDEHDLAAIVFVQDEATKEILQAGYLPFPAPNTITGIEIDADAKLKIYPNPTSSTLHVEFNTLEERKVKVFDQFGKLVTSEDVSSAVRLYEINTSEFASGLYYLQVEGNISEINRRKFIVSH